MDEQIENILNTLRIMSRDNEGVVIEPIGLSDEGVLSIKYNEGTNEDCPECILQPDSFKDMLLRMCNVQAPQVQDVELVSA